MVRCAWACEREHDKVLSVFVELRGLLFGVNREVNAAVRFYFGEGLCVVAVGAFCGGLLGEAEDVELGYLLRGDDLSVGPAGEPPAVEFEILIVVA